MDRAQYFLYFATESNLNNINSDELVVIHNLKIVDEDDFELDIEVDLSEVNPSFSSSTINNY